MARWLRCVNQTCTATTQSARWRRVPDRAEKSGLSRSTTVATQNRPHRLAWRLLNKCRRSTEQQPSGPIIIPSEVQLAGSVEGDCGRTGRVIYFVFGSPAEPFANFSVPISKGETTSAVMVGGRGIAPLGRNPVHNEKGIVDRIGMFINGEPRKRRVGNLRCFQILSITCVRPRLACRRT